MTEGGTDSPAQQQQQQSGPPFPQLISTPSENNKDQYQRGASQIFITLYMAQATKLAASAFVEWLSHSSA